MGVTIRQRSDKTDGAYYVFVNHMNKRTSFRVGSHRAAVEVQQELQVMLALDKAIHDLRPRRGKLKPPEMAEALRMGDDLRRRLRRLLDELEALLNENRRRVQ